MKTRRTTTPQKPILPAGTASRWTWRIHYTVGMRGYVTMIEIDCRNSDDPLIPDGYAWTRCPPLADPTEAHEPLAIDAMLRFCEQPLPGMHGHRGCSETIVDWS